MTHEYVTDAPATTPAPLDLIDPATGEVIPIDAPAETIAEWLDNTLDLERRIRDAKRVAYDELLRRMDARASWTIDTPRFKIVGESPDRVEYDAAKLMVALAELLAAGAISPDAAAAALEVEEVRKPRARGINQIRKLGGFVRDRLDDARVPVEKPRRVSVKINRE